MKEVAELAAWVALIAALVFLFKGDPSVFELLHNAAITAIKDTK